MEALFGLLIPTTFVLYLVLERMFPARVLPKRRYWLVQGIAFFVASSAIRALPPTLLAGKLAPHAPVHLDGLPTVAAAVIVFLATDLVTYFVHRLQHNWPWLWRWTHQMHHAAERVDIAGVALMHPFDVLVYATLGTLVAVLLGVTPAAAALSGLIGASIGMFPHLNIRTPRWLGYIIQRPEAHSIHHARGVHAYNYGDFMLWDLVFGTFRNPVTFTAGPAGFWDGASRRLVPMLAGRDIAEPTT
jgi:sterol desaturase/sphingolipid hydroxylase (fatty acid hydroxylase superfamily)